MTTHFWSWLPFGLAALGAALLTPLVMQLAWRLGAVAQPRSDRWHQHPTALMGGIAIYLASAAAAGLVLPIALPAGREALSPCLALGAAATLLFALGLIDDRRGLGPGAKLAGQAAAACLLILTGVHVPCVTSPWLAALLTILWVVGITNAINLLDNMDGVLAGVVAIAALVLAGLSGGSGAVTVVALALAGACCGFLVYNFHPARIFMGDCGSLYLGFSISALSLMAGMRIESCGLGALVGPGAVLAIPIFDTALVIITRRRDGRPVMQGGRDHTSHRLVALGISERGVALVFYAFGAALAGFALVAVRLPSPAVAALGVAGIAIFGLLGTLLLKVPVYAAPAKGGLTTSARQARRWPVPAQPQPHTPALQEPST
jgi:UDP-GlcNAc:undecaprenyl-phosphate/decaprenyl-phosphate GlcNAc-1-phosphate transferase